MKIFAFGSSIDSCYRDSGAAYYRGCYKYLARRGHEVVFAEPDAYGRRKRRDSSGVSYVESLMYRPGRGIDAMLRRALLADVVIKHSGLGVDDELLEQRVLECCRQSVLIFWDADPSATIIRMKANPRDPFLRAVPRYDAVFTYGGGPESSSDYLKIGARSCYSIHHGVDSETHYPVEPDPGLKCDLAFLGNRSPERESRVDELFFKAAKLAPEKDFLLGGEGWEGKEAPMNVRWIGHVPASEHNRINCSAGMVINISRSSIAERGYAPPNRIFEAAGAAACMLSDEWPGLKEFFDPGREIFVVRSAEDVAAALRSFDRSMRWRAGTAFFAAAMQRHTYGIRARQAEEAIRRCIADRLSRRNAPRREAGLLARGAA